MIEISHKQAQHLIREGEDRRLPEEQWAVLYAHLEGCPDCRAYRQRIESYERDLRRLLHLRWGGVRGPDDRTSGRVNGFFQRRRRVRAFMKKASTYILGLALLVGYITYRQLTAPPPEPTPTPEFGAKPLYTSTPAPLQSIFRGLIALETRRDGNAEIYLLNGSPNGPQFTNLTQNPAWDTWPSWSPDGEWIAFLSDRTGKNEVFITHVAGSRLTQVTNAPGIEWSGPIQWSYDGRWLGVSGYRGRGNRPSFLYLIPIDGSSEPRSIAYTINASNQFHFSPSQPAMAFLTSYRSGGIEVVNTDTGWLDDVTLEDNRDLHLAAGEGGAFDWSLGGGNIVYTADAQAPADQAAPNNQASENGSQEAQIRMSPAIQIADSQFYYTTGAQAVDTVASPNRFRAVSWVPHSLIVASLVRAEKTAGSAAGPSADCWVLRLRNAYNNTQSPRTLDDFCVTGGLDRANWTPDGNWLVVIGRKPAETTSALYALRLPEMAGRENTSRESLLPSGSTYLERLADIPAEDIAEANALSQSPDQAFLFEPQVRPGGQLLQLLPKAALPPASMPAPAAPPSTLPGWIAYTVQQGTDSWIMRARPNGGESLLLTGKRGEHSCPRISPDGKLVAFLSGEAPGQPAKNEVYIVGLDGKNPVQLTGGTAPGRQRTPRYDCPVWSPDGKLLAAVYRSGNQAPTYLAVIPVDSQTPPRYLQMVNPSNLAAPVWIPTDPQDSAKGSNKILLVNPRNGRYGGQVGLFMVDVLNSQDLQPAIITGILGLPGWDDMQWLALSPDGRYLAMELVYENLAADQNRQGRTYAALQVIEWNSLRDIAEVNLPHYDPAANGFGGLTWLPDGKVGLVHIDGLIGPGKTLFDRFDPLSGRSQVRLEQLARFEDLTYHAVWIQGRWAVFTAESGLWALNLEDAQSNRAAPFLLTDERVVDLDWK